jgi:hypothetical protein
MQQSFTEKGLQKSASQGNALGVKCSSSERRITTQPFVSPQGKSLRADVLAAQNTNRGARVRFRDLWERAGGSVGSEVKQPWTQ